jgi:hypothetical protein
MTEPDEGGFCITGCPDDVCRMSGHCAWPASGPEPDSSLLAAEDDDRR